MLDPMIEQYCKDAVVDIRGFDRCEFVSASEGEFVMRAHPGPDCGNNIGTVHGGYLLALMDVAATAAMDSMGRETSTMTLTANFMRPVHVDDEYIIVTGRVMRAGGRTGVSEVLITRPNGEVAAQATSTIARLKTNILDLPDYAPQN